MSDYLHVVKVVTNRQIAARLEAHARFLTAMSVVWRDEDRDRVVFEEYFSERATAQRRHEVVQHIVRELGIRSGMTVRVGRMQARDWSESWKVHFKVERISRRIVVRPSWESYRAERDECVITLDPGMSFGTGRHPTTRACLRFLDRLTDEPGKRTFCDIGCGSGILAIAASKLGFGPVEAVDNDADAVRIARENAQLNGVGRRIRFTVADLARWKARRPFDVVAANVLADVLSRHVRTVSAVVAPGGVLLLAGILKTQYEPVRRTYVRSGFREIKAIQEQEWKSGMFRREC